MKIESIQLSHKCSAVAFYGFKHSDEVVKNAYNIILEWYSANGVQPNQVAVKGPGHRGGYADFKRTDAKLKKFGFAGVTYFELHVFSPIGGDGNLFDSYYMSEYITPMIVMMSRIPSVDLMPNTLLLSTNVMIQKVNPEYGIGYAMDYRKDAFAFARGFVESGMDTEGIGLETESRNGWVNFGLSGRAWHDGQLRNVYPWNFVSEKHLSQMIDGIPLREWIQTSPSKGEVTAMSDELSLWSINASDLSEIRTVLTSNGIIFDWVKYYYKDMAERNQIAQQPVIASSIENTEEHQKKLIKRNNLINKIRALSDQTPEVVVGLDEYFDGNWDESSLAPNMDAKPKLQECYRILKRIRDREDVQDVLVAIQETPTPDDANDFDMWPTSDTVYILTSCTLKQVKQWTKALMADETENRGQKWLTYADIKPAGAPDLQSGMSVYALWWD